MGNEIEAGAKAGAELATTLLAHDDALRELDSRAAAFAARHADTPAEQAALASRFFGAAVAAYSQAPAVTPIPQETPA